MGWDKCKGSSAYIYSDRAHINMYIYICINQSKGFVLVVYVVSGCVEDETWMFSGMFLDALDALVVGALVVILARSFLSSL